MSAHVLLNLLNELRKRDTMRGLPSILSIFLNEVNKLNNKGARILLWNRVLLNRSTVFCFGIVSY